MMIVRSWTTSKEKEKETGRSDPKDDESELPFLSSAPLLGGVEDNDASSTLCRPSAIRDRLKLGRTVGQPVLPPGAQHAQHTVR